MRVYCTPYPLKKPSWQLIMWVWSLHLHSVWSVVFLALLQCDLLTNIKHLMCFSTQTTLATGQSSPRSQVTAFSLWALTISRFLLIAEQKEVQLLIIGTCKPQDESTEFNIELMCTGNILSIKETWQASNSFNFIIDKKNIKWHFYSICRWTVDGREIRTESGPNYSLVEGNLLINNPHVVKHRGVYQCIATNTFGTIISREAKVQFACQYTYFVSLSFHNVNRSFTINLEVKLLCVNHKKTKKTWSQPDQ